MNLVCIGGPNGGEMHCVSDTAREGDIICIRQPVKPITVEEVSETEVINPLSEEGRRRAAKRMTQRLERYLFEQGALRYITPTEEDKDAG